MAVRVSKNVRAMKQIRIPRRIDEPPHILMWSADELVPMFTGLIVGLLIEQAFICTCIGYGLTSLYRRFRDNRPDGYLMHLFYRSGLMISKSRTMLNPFIKQLLP